MLTEKIVLVDLGTFSLKVDIKKNHSLIPGISKVFKSLIRNSPSLKLTQKHLWSFRFVCWNCWKESRESGKNLSEPLTGIQRLDTRTKCYFFEFSNRCLPDGFWSPFSEWHSHRSNGLWKFILCLSLMYAIDAFLINRVLFQRLHSNKRLLFSAISIIVFAVSSDLSANSLQCCSN